MKTALLDFSLDELKEYIKELGEPAYRAGQIMSWMLRGVELDDMTNLPAALRARLSESAEVGVPTVARRLVSSIDGTVKYLFRLSDGQCVESVVMKYEHGNTICVSTQVGCRMGCRFCASTIGGLVRHLRPGEILGQVIAAQRDTGERIDGIVLMGIGEPLDNYNNVIKFLRLVGSPDGLNIGYRHISLSTCGLADRIPRLAEEHLPITLSISLHAVSDNERSEIMPINRRFNIDTLLCACRDYFDKTGRRISFEFTLIAGKNDDSVHAARLASLLHRYFGSEPCHVNLIPVNEVKEREFRRSPRSRQFCEELCRLGVNATVRRHLGADINASCGQLRRAEGLGDTTGGIASDAVTDEADISGAAVQASALYPRSSKSKKKAAAGASPDRTEAEKTPDGAEED